MKRLVILALAVLAVPLLLVVLYWALLFFGQRRMMFPAPPASEGSRPPAGARRVDLLLAEGKTEAWYLPPFAGSGIPGGRAPLLVFGHGNGELIDFWPGEFDEPRRWGFAVLLVEYPGYGRSAGSPSRDSIRRAFAAAYDWAAAEPAIDPARIIGYGRSIGGGAICDLSRDRPLAALILESTFTTTRAFAAAMHVPGFLVRDRFDNLAAVVEFAATGRPLLILHGERDEIIPTAHGRELAAAGGVPLTLLPCGHNDCPRAWDSVLDFLRRASLAGNRPR